MRLICLAALLAISAPSSSLAFGGLGGSAVRHVLTAFSLFTFVPFAHAADYYKLLGVSRDASTRDIRRAFKKLALEKHPDKNPHDPNAHANFVQINTAFEVLKDEETRKKYDTHGEAGLNDQQQGGQYQGWSYYNEEFGLYDEDTQIETLTAAVFWSSVYHTDELWFVNFYSPGCSHCHELAPTWRQLAARLAGIVHVGAVNCYEQWGLCNQIGISGYPSLLFFSTPGKMDAHNDVRDLDALIHFALSFAPPRKQLDDASFESFVGDTNQHRAVWVCHGDCDPDATAMLGLALQPHVALAVLPCQQEPVLCEHNEFTESHVRFYPAGSSNGTQAYPSPDSMLDHEVSPAAAAAAVFELFPSLPQMTLTQLDASIREGRLVDQTGEALLLLFVQPGQQTSNEASLALRRTRLVADIDFLQFDCAVSPATCTLFVGEIPGLALFKSNGHEVYHGRLRASDVATWAEAGLGTTVTALGPDAYRETLGDKNPWFIDFYAPWCPPCRDMLPHFRTASARAAAVTLVHAGTKSPMTHHIRFGTVDCARHPDLCQSVGITNYPSLLFFNRPDATPHRYSGGASEDELVRFVEDMLDPPVVTLTPQLFKEIVTQSTDLVLVDFFAPWCGHCMELEPHLRAAARALRGIATIASVDCVQHNAFCQREAINAYPTLKIYPPGKKRKPVFYQGHRFANAIVAELIAQLPKKVQTLTANTFRTAESGSSPWLVSFGAPWCGPCQNFQPHFAVAVHRLLPSHSDLKAGYLDCQAHQHICQSLGLPHYPYVMLFTKQGSYQMASQDSGEIVKWADNILRVSSKTLGKRDEL